MLRRLGQDDEFAARHRRWQDGRRPRHGAPRENDRGRRRVKQRRGDGGAAAAAACAELPGLRNRLWLADYNRCCSLPGDPTMTFPTSTHARSAVCGVTPSARHPGRRWRYPRRDGHAVRCPPADRRRDGRRPARQPDRPVRAERLARPGLHRAEPGRHRGPAAYADRPLRASGAVRHRAAGELPGHRRPGRDRGGRPGHRVLGRARLLRAPPPLLLRGGPRRSSSRTPRRRSGCSTWPTDGAGRA